jgi:hypothetical protein
METMPIAKATANLRLRLENLKTANTPIVTAIPKPTPKPTHHRLTLLAPLLSGTFLLHSALQTKGVPCLAACSKNLTWNGEAFTALPQTEHLTSGIYDSASNNFSP